MPPQLLADARATGRATRAAPARGRGRAARRPVVPRPPLAWVLHGRCWLGVLGWGAWSCAGPETLQGGGAHTRAHSSASSVGLKDDAAGAAVYYAGLLHAMRAPAKDIE